jgi:signal transduction histidine kinase
MNRASLKLKFSLFFGLITVIICVVLGLFFFTQTKKVMLENFTRRGLSTAENLAFNSQYAVFSEDRNVLENLLLGILNIEDVVYVAVFSREGKSLVNKTRLKPFQVNQETVDIPPLSSKVLTSSLPLMESFTSKNGERVYNFSSPVILKPAKEKSDRVTLEILGEEEIGKSKAAGEINEGWVQVGMSPALLNQKIQKILMTGVSVTLIMMIGGVYFIYYLSKFYIRPLETLARVAQRVSEGDLSQTAPVTSKDEIGDLTGVFNQMTHSLSQRDHEIKTHTDRLNAVNSELLNLNTTLEERVRRRTETLEEVDRLKSEFVSHVSHELRTPLTSIKGYIDNFRDGIAGPLTDRQADYLDRMKKNTDRLVRLIDDLLQISRIESGKIELAVVPVSVFSIVNDVVNNLKSLAAEKRLKIVIEKFDEFEQVPGDRDKLEQVMINLLDNAIKFSPENDQVTISFQKGPKFLITSFIDHGPGIAPEEQTRIFDRFYQVGHELFAQKKGTGLGLFIAKELIELHGGQIWVTSARGKGSAFSFTLPLIRR